MDRVGGKRMCYNVAPPSSWYNVHINSATTIKTCNCHTAFLASGFSGYFTTLCSRLSSLARKKRRPIILWCRLHISSTTFEQQDRFSQNRTDIMPLKATTHALKSSRCALIITGYKHKFSLNTTLILFQSLSYIFRS